MNFFFKRNNYRLHTFVARKNIANRKQPWNARNKKVQQLNVQYIFVLISFVVNKFKLKTFTIRIHRCIEN